MAQIIWTEPALNDLDAVADYIAVEAPIAGGALVQRIFRHVDQLEAHPESGPRVPELKRSRYRQIVEPPCRVIYRFDREKIFILHVMRSEQLLRKSLLKARG
jgi:plasmid stabilization system protein ParE